MVHQCCTNIAKVEQILHPNICAHTNPPGGVLLHLLHGDRVQSNAKCSHDTMFNYQDISCILALIPLLIFPGMPPSILIYDMVLTLGKWFSTT